MTPSLRKEHERKVALLQAAFTRINATPESSRAFLKEAGILNKKGDLAKRYRS